ncbi:MAG: hypothetical protein HY231_04665 [Acidobacteria bacterium]|nr:hypothetical protein [Acidobacteriota bacterium]
MIKFLKRVLAAPFVVVAAFFILLEDWLWDDLARWAAAIGRLPIFHQLETLILKLPPYGALVLFAAPSLLLVPIKLAALYFISRGQAALGMMTILAAKVFGTALVARIFTLTKPTLMRLPWFVWVYTRFTKFKARIYDTIKATAVYRLAHRQRLRLSRRWQEWKAQRRGFLRRRWDAAVRFWRKRKQPQE